MSTRGAQQQISIKPQRKTSAWRILVLLHVLAIGVTAVAELRPRPPVFKPTHTTLDDRFQPRRLTVKFNDGLNIRVRNGQLTDFGSGELDSACTLLDSLTGAKWLRTDSVPEATIDQMRFTAQTNLGMVIADLNLQFILALPSGTNLAGVIDAFNALDIVELAQPIQHLSPLPTPPDFQPQQGYLLGPPGGINAVGAWRPCVPRGNNVQFADVECTFNLNHIDLQTVGVLGGDMNLNDQFMEDHGTASLGVVGSHSNGFGTTGIAPDCTMFFSGVMFWNNIDFLFEYNAPGAIMTAIASLGAGDVLLIELEAQGPVGFCPIEWEKPCYDRIVLAIGLGIVVVEPAGNGNNSLDHPLYSTGNNGHWPFIQAQDSGAIIVGAGAAPANFGGSDTARSRLPFSTYGSRVNVQGWGEAVTTTGFGGLYNLGGNNEKYTSGFSGTSSASPVVAGACVLMEAAAKAQNGILTPNQVRQALIATGSPQQAGLNPVSEHIGPLPDVNAAIYAMQPPVISYNNAGPTMILHWKICGAILQSAEILSPGSGWTDVPTADNTYSYNFAPGTNSPTKFFRLYIPPAAQ